MIEPSIESNGENANIYDQEGDIAVGPRKQYESRSRQDYAEQGHAARAEPVDKISYKRATQSAFQSSE